MWSPYRLLCGVKVTNGRRTTSLWEQTTKKIVQGKHISRDENHLIRWLGEWKGVRLWIWSIKLIMLEIPHRRQNYSMIEVIPSWIRFFPSLLIFANKKKCLFIYLFCLALEFCIFCANTNEFRRDLCFCQSQKCVFICVFFPEWITFGQWFN